MKGLLKIGATILAIWVWIVIVFLTILILYGWKEVFSGGDSMDFVASVVLTGLDILIVYFLVIKPRMNQSRKQAKQILLNQENKIPRLEISKTEDFMSEEEKMVNHSFRDYVRVKDNIRVATAHVEYLIKQKNAYEILKKRKNVLELDETIRQWNNTIEKTKANSPEPFHSSWVNTFYKIDDVRKAYTMLLERLPNDKVDWISDYFQSPKIKIVKCSNYSAVVFLPMYMLYYSSLTQPLKIVSYRELKTQTDSSGDVWLTVSQIKAFVGISDYQKAKAYEKNILLFVNMMSNEYGLVADRMMAHDERLKGVESIDILLSPFQVKKQEEAKKSAYRYAKMEELEEKQKSSAGKATLQNNTSHNSETRKKTEHQMSTAQSGVSDYTYHSEYTIYRGALVRWDGNKKNAVLKEGLFTSVGGAFQNNTSIQSVVIPFGVNEIKDRAFQGCLDLMNIEIPVSVVRIGVSAFEKCSSISSISLPETLKEISPKMLAECVSLESIVIPKGVKGIGQRAFWHCEKLEEIIIPEGVETIDEGAFQGCTALKRVVLSDSVRDIREGVFSKCVSLEHVKFGKGIKQIPTNCFRDLNNLISVTVSNSLEEIGDRAFCECISLQRVYFEDTQSQEKTTNNASSCKLIRIGQYAFENCVSLTQFDLNRGLRSIGDHAFDNCVGLESIYIPDSIEVFGEGVFQRCASLSEVIGADCVAWSKKSRFTGTPWLAQKADGGFVIVENRLENYVGQDDSILVPKAVKTIGDHAFADNKTLVYVTLQNGLEVIETQAFANCRNLKMVEIPDSVRWIDDSAFWGASKVVIRCTRGSVASAFRIRNGLPGEYVAKRRETKPTGKVTQNTRIKSGDDLIGLSEEERRVILEMRRKKHLDKQKEETAVIQPQKKEYQVIEPDESKIGIRLTEDNRQITNNIFYLRFVQNGPADGGKDVTDYEVFVTDTNGNIISDVVVITADLLEEPLIHKKSFILSSQVQFDKTAEYFVIIRYKGAYMDILSKTPYHINIAFASDFDF